MKTYILTLLAVFAVLVGGTSAYRAYQGETLGFGNPTIISGGSGSVTGMGVFGTLTKGNVLIAQNTSTAGFVTGFNLVTSTSALYLPGGYTLYATNTTAVNATSGLFAISGTGGLGYMDFLAQSSNTASPPPGTTRIHSATIQGFTRLEQDNEAGTNIVLGRDSVTIVRNTSGASIAKGKVVRISGSTGNVPNISLAYASSSSALPAIFVAVDTIADNAFGQVMRSGIVSSFDTSAFTSGDPVWVSTSTPGGLTKIRPSGLVDSVQRVGTILVSGVGNGSIDVNIAPAILNMETGTNASLWTASNISITSGTSTSIFAWQTATGTLTNLFTLNVSGTLDTKAGIVTCGGANCRKTITISGAGCDIPSLAGAVTSSLIYNGNNVDRGVFFSPLVYSRCQGSQSIPDAYDGGTMSCYFINSATTTDANGVTMGIQAQAVGNGALLSTEFSAATATQTFVATTTNDYTYSTATTLTVGGATAGTGRRIRYQITRSNVGASTNTTAYIEAKCEYGVTGLSDN